MKMARIGSCGAVAVAVALLAASCGDSEDSDVFPGAGNAGATGGSGGGSTGCPSGLIECGGECVDPDFDPSHCGTCDNACDPGQVCSFGQCGTECTGGTTMCGELCVDTQTNPLHCGDCDSPCGDEEVCSAGQCGTTCVGGTTMCGDLCVDTNVDPENCGGCADDPNPGDHICGAGEVCSAGQCGMACVGGTTLCGGLCVDTNVDPGNCGGCGNDPNPGDNICGAGEVCSAGQCGLSCVGGTTLCGTLCVDTNVDPGNCGGCGNDPNPGDNICGGDELCSGGQCGLSCLGGTTECGGLCVDTSVDPGNCGGCANDPNPGDNICTGDDVCTSGVCGLQCSGGTTECNGLCVDILVDPANCGGCANDPNPGDHICAGGEVCSNGSCGVQCGGGTTLCGGTCVDTSVDPGNCGGCANDPNPGDHICAGGELCQGGTCTSLCGVGLTKCGNECVDILTNELHCGGCGNDPNPGDHICGPGDDCINGQCQSCDSAVTDCDGDGWMAADNDCCDKPGTCGWEPELVNPGAIEVVGNGVDDNCNGLIDMFDTMDTVSCDQGLSSNSADPMDYVKALGLCRTTLETPPSLDQKTWGIIDAQILRADGTALNTPDQHSIRNFFGSVAPSTVEGQSAVVLSSGIASDGTQVNPGPNGGVPNGFNVSTGQGSGVDIASCSSPLCIDDWYTTANPPLKNANELPSTPSCTNGTNQPTARDSVMLYIRMRAPTNVKAFSFNSYFISAEYPEYVCSTYNDQLVALVDTPNGTPQPIPNPIDKNLMTFNDGQDLWPVGINIASGTSLFSVCDASVLPPTPACGANSVASTSCMLGNGQLNGTGFESTGSCDIGGGTFWLTTAGNVIPGDILELRIVVWDVGDTILDSLALIDGFQWLPNATTPGTS